MSVAFNAWRGRRRIVEPGDRIAEAMIGLVMALTFTGTLSVADAGRNDVRAMLVGALGCNLAWGLIDGIVYVMITAAQRGSEHGVLREVRTSGDHARARRLLAEALPPEVSSVLADDELESMRARLAASPTPASPPRVGLRDLLAGFAVTLIVFCTTLPISLPFVFLDEVRTAMRFSNAIAIAMLFAAGAIYARTIGRPPWAVGLAMVTLGVVLVVVTIALGG